MITKKKIYSLKADRSNIRLDKFLSEKIPDLSRVVLQDLIHTGNAKVNGMVVVKKSSHLRSGDAVQVYYEPQSLKPNLLKIKTVFEDEDVLVFDKPPALQIHPTVANQKESLVGAVLASYPEIVGVGEDDFRPGVVHRLDADTSGLLIVAKTRIAFDYLKDSFKNRKVEKEYIALVHGQVARHGVLDASIGRKAGRGRLQTGIGRISKTEYWLTTSYKNGLDSFSLVRIILHTGRTHQIRVHFSSVGFPVAGDKLYGGSFKKHDQEIFPRQFLHASRLKLKLPSGKEREFNSDLPVDLTTVLDKLQKISKIDK